MLLERDMAVEILAAGRRVPYLALELPVAHAPRQAAVRQGLLVHEAAPGHGLRQLPAFACATFSASALRSSAYVPVHSQEKFFAFE